MLSERIKRLRERQRTTTPTICLDRARLVTKYYSQVSNEPMVLHRAKFFKYFLENRTIFIDEDSLLAGHTASRLVGCPVFVDVLSWLSDEIENADTRAYDPYQFLPGEKEELKDLASKWKGHTFGDYTKEQIDSESALMEELGIFTIGSREKDTGANAPDYYNLVKRGYRFYIDECRKQIASLDNVDVDALGRKNTWESFIIVMEAIIDHAHRYADLAEKMSAECSNAERRQQLLTIAENCRTVPEHPPKNFHQATQLVWFTHLAFMLEGNGHNHCLGRFDQYMYPYAKADLESGRETQDSIVERLTNLWIKTLTINKVRSQAHTFSSAGSPLYQNVTIGGQTRDKKDAVNPLSYLVLKSVAQAHLPQPNLTVRYHAGLNPDFMNEAIEVMKLGFGMPAFNNDEIIIPSFIEKGVKEQDAYDYSAIGCVETAVPGKWGYRCTGMSYMNFPKVLLIAMNDGIDPSSGKRFAPAYGRFVDMQSYDDLKTAWDKTLRYLTRMSVIVENSIDLSLEREVPDILCSALTDDCIGRGKHLKEGGAVYDYISGLQVGIANLSDSLAAVKKLVFEEKRISTSELWSALQSDYAGERGEEIRQMLINDAPKYGNDDDYADKLVRDCYDVYVDEIAKYPNTRYGRGPIGGIRYSGTSSISANVGQGRGTLATPDGRHAGTPLAEGCSPAHNMDKHGPTSVLKSVSKLPTDEIVGGVLLNQKVNPQTLAKEEDKQKLIALLRTFFNRLHGYHIQYNVVSRETLIDAQKHPEKHRDLIVRVAGYSAFFNVLSKATQDDIIARTEHAL